MTMTSAVSTLARLLTQSGGAEVAVAGGKLRSFIRGRPCAAHDVALVLRSCGHLPPSDYLEMVQELGECRLFVDEEGTPSIEVHHPSDIDMLYSEVFDDPSSLWNLVLPVITLNRLQELGVFLWHEGEWRFTVVPHDEHPDDWVESIGQTPNLGELLEEAISGGGDMPVH